MDIAGRPFRGSEALAAGVVSRHQLRTEFDMVHRDVYLRRGQRLTPERRAVAAWLWSGRTATVAGLSAAALHGSAWIDDRLPAELNRPSRDKARGIVLQSDTLDSGETCLLRGIATTTPARTAFDLGRRKGLTAAVIRLDALMRATDVKAADVTSLIDQHPGVRGLVQLRQALNLADGGAESPWETRTRLVLVGGRLPSPATQIRVRNDAGAVFARIDMGWEQWRVGVEFDGAQHWTDPAQRSWDIDRLAELEARGWTIIRVSADMLRHRPHVVIERVARALRSAGCPL